MSETSKFVDKFDREDGPVGPNYLLACGEALILDEIVWPVTVLDQVSPELLNPTHDRKVQVLYQASLLDGPNYAVRAVWSHLAELPGIQPISQLLAKATQDPSFTILVRMTKDPLLIDLEQSRVGGSARSYDFEPQCYDQGYGLRVTCPRDGSAPILKIIKFSPPVIGPGVSGPATLTEVDRARVLVSKTLEAKHMHLADDTDVKSYRGFVQEMRLRIRRADDQVILEAYLNDRNMNVPILTFTDRQQPLWGAAGLPGFEFLNALALTQPAGTSPFTAKGIPLMACHAWEVETIKDYARPTVTSPSNFYTYRRVAERVALLIEKDGDTKFTATARTLSRLEIYEQFVFEAEQEILRLEGYWWFLERTASFFSVEGQEAYEVPENVSMPLGVYRKTPPARPLKIILEYDRRELIPNAVGTGIPMIAVFYGTGVNDRQNLILTPIPDKNEGEYELLYYARWIHPNDTTTELPLIPQEHMDVLVYGAAAMATAHNTDPNDVQSFKAFATSKVQGLRRANNRKVGRRTIMRHVTDRPDPALHSLYPLTRAAQLSQNFFIR
jgi:hypothetical protein